MKEKTAWQWARWFLLYAVVSLAIARFGDPSSLRISYGVLLYLLIIVGTALEGGRIASVCMVGAGYLAVNWLFVPPRRAFGQPSHLDVVILVGFLATGLVISQLVVTLKQTATIAIARAEEIERLSTERLQLERVASRAHVLQEAERLKNALLASLTHDLRSPITTMGMLAESSSVVPHSEALRRIGDEVRRLEEFVSAIGRFASVAGAETLLVLETHVVEDLVGAALRSSEAGLIGHPVHVESGPMLLVHCDFTLSLKILDNLLVNAARYTPPGSPIDISAREVDRQVYITVADRGAGLDREEAVRLFRPLERGRETADGPPGSGMGLSIARAFAHAQHGSVVFRAREGGGSCFELRLPAAPASGPAAVIA